MPRYTLWAMNNERSLMNLCLLLIFVSHGLAQSRLEKDEAALRFYNNKAPKSPYQAVKIFECTDTTFSDALKYIKDAGKDLIENHQANGTSVFVLIGQEDNDKTLLANTFGSLSLDARPGKNIEVFPRFVGKTSDSSVIIEAADLGSNSAAGHIAGIYILNKMIENNIGIKLIFAYIAPKLAVVWNYFKRISENNPKIGMDRLSQSESFTLTEVDAFGGKIQDWVKNPKFLARGFGKNNAVLLNKRQLKKQQEANKQHLEETYAKSEFVTGVKIPVLPGYQSCVEDKLHKKIVDSLKESASKIIEHFQGVEKNESLSDNGKSAIFKKAWTKFLNIINTISDEMAADALTAPLADFAKELNLEEGSDKAKEAGEYAQLLIMVQDSYKTTAWSEGLEPLESYLKIRQITFDIVNTVNEDLFDCTETSKVRHMLYELEFEVTANSSDPGDTMVDFFRKYKDLLGDSFAEEYQLLVNEGIDRSYVHERILEKLRSYTESQCAIPNDEENNQGSCDDSEIEELIELLGKGSVNESSSDDFVVFIMGEKESSKKREVANILANLQVDSPPFDDPLLYTEYLDKPVNATYTVVSAPSFSKEKSNTQSVVSKYFTYKSIQSALAAKLIVTIDQSSLSEEAGVLEETLESAARVMIGADNFHRCVGFVVTNVELADGEKITDKSAEEGEKLVKRLEEISKKDEVGNVTKTFISMFFSEEGRAIKQISILVNSAKLGDANVFEENRQHLLDTFDKNLQFVSYTSKNYFDLLRKTDKQLSLCSAKKTKNRISENINLMLSDAREVYKLLEEHQDGDYKSVFSKMDHVAERISEVIHDTTEFSSVKESLTPILDFLAELEVNVGSDTLDVTGTDVDFVGAMGKSSSRSFTSGFGDLTGYIEKSRRWYYFLNKLEHCLSQFAIISKKNDYRSAAEKLLAKIRMEAAERDDILEFIDSIDELPIDALKNLLGDISPSLRKLAFLGDLIYRIFMSEMKMDCSEEVNLCQGTYLTVSSCLENLCLTDKPIEIVALNVVYLDTDIVKNGSTLSIFSPVWQIIGNREINLDGGHAPAGPRKAKNGEGAKVKGADGKPGLPGEPGGNFFGIGETFVKTGGSTLKITAKGGNGSSGQDGGDGGPGPKPDPPDFCEACDDTSKVDFESQGFRLSESCNERVETSTVCHIYLEKDGNQAGDGGDGGAPGFAGMSGSINVIFYDNRKRHDFTMVLGGGSMGKAGAGGLPGIDVRGSFYVTEEKVHWLVKAATYRYRWGAGEKYEERSRSGALGKPGINDKDRKPAEAPKPLPAFPVALNRYKSFIRQSTTSKNRNPTPLHFYDKIEADQDMNRMYDVTSLADDFQRLEKYAPSLRKITPVGPFFESFLPRLANYSAIRNHSDEVRKTLAFLYTVVLSTLSAGRNREGFIVMDIQGYLKTTITAIEQLKNLENDKIVQSYKDDYEKNVDNNIKEANKLINEEIKPVVENYKEEMTNQIESLSAEVAEMKKNAQIQKEALEKKKEQLKRTLVWRKAMTVVGGVVSLMSFMGPTAGAIGSALNAGARIVESIALSGDQDPTVALQSIPGAVNQQLTSVIQIIESKKSRFSDQLEQIESQIQKAGGADSDKNLKGIIEKVDTTKAELAKIDPKKLDPNAVKTINSLQSGVSNSLAEKKLAISKFQENDNKQDKKITAIGYMQAAVNTGDMIARDVSRIRQTDAQLDEVNQQIKENSANIRKLDRYEENIHAKMMPMVRNIMEKVDGLGTENAGKSHAALDVAQWKTEEYLADMRQTMRKMTQGFKMSEELENVFNKIDRAMRTMTQVFLRIQDNEDKRDLAVFLADINSNSASEINVKDPFLNNLLRDIQISIKRHLILESFEKSYNSFTQAFFPFGVELVRDFGLPSQFHGSNSTEITVVYAVQRIKQMINKIQITSTTITKYDEFIYNEFPFQGGDSEIFPAFYTWKYEDHMGAISKLLTGQTIEMNADITKVHEENESKNAIKFNSLRLALVARDEDLQPKLDKALNKFFVKFKTLGTFLYKCNDNYYEISNDALTIRISHVLGKNGDDPAAANDVYKKIRANTAMFSPYGKWNITLDGKSAALKGLKEFQNKPMDLELVGEGFYVDEESDICRSELKLMYNQIPV